MTMGIRVMLVVSCQFVSLLSLMTACTICSSLPSGSRKLIDASAADRVARLAVVNVTPAAFSLAYAASKSLTRKRHVPQARLKPRTLRRIGPGVLARASARSSPPPRQRLAVPDAPSPAASASFCAITRMPNVWQYQSTSLRTS